MLQIYFWRFVQQLVNTSQIHWIFSVFCQKPTDMSQTIIVWIITNSCAIKTSKFPIDASREMLPPHQFLQQAKVRNDRKQWSFLPMGRWVANLKDRYTKNWSGHLCPLIAGAVQPPFDLSSLFRVWPTLVRKGLENQQKRCLGCQSQMAVSMLHSWTDPRREHLHEARSQRGISVWQIMNFNNDDKSGGVEIGDSYSCSKIRRVLSTGTLRHPAWAVWVKVQRCENRIDLRHQIICSIRKLY